MSKPILVIRIKDPEHAVRVQNTLFALGYYWYDKLDNTTLVKHLGSDDNIVLHNSIYINKLMVTSDYMLHNIRIYGYLPAEDKDLAKYLLLGEVFYETK
jgi:hypothetical protein